MKKPLSLYIYVALFLAVSGILFVYVEAWTQAVSCALGAACILAIINFARKKEQREKEMDEKHSEEFKRIRRARNSGYEYAYTEYEKSSFDRIYDWERSEFEDIIWREYQSGIIKFAELLPYLEKYDGMSRLREDLESPNTPETWKEMIALALARATADGR